MSGDPANPRDDADRFPDLHPDLMEQIEHFGATALEWKGRALRAEAALKHIADQRLSGAARNYWEGEYGEDAEPDFEGGYDSIIQSARRYFEESK